MRTALALLLFLAGNAPAAAPPAGGSRQILSVASPRVTGGEFSRRLLSPISADDIARFLESEGRTLAPETFVRGRESIDVFVPAEMPASGFGLIVFVPAGDDFFLPRDWKGSLERRGIVFVSLRGAGNSTDVIGRRIPMVLHAAEHAIASLRIDPARVYVSGFSGGARLAQRVALGWPDLFSGSLQFAGSVVIGTHRLPPPALELMARFQENTRVVMVSGNVDLPNRRNDAEAREGLRALCVAGERGFAPARLDHWVPDGRAFARALEMLETPVAVDPAAQADCRRRLAADIAGELDAAKAEADRADWQPAVDRLVALDDRYGGLAAPRSVELARAIMARRDGH